MDVILWRHAEAEDARGGQDDLDRALTHAGRKQAARVGAWLDKHLPTDTRVLCSPALRCQQTSLGLGRRYDLCQELAPGATAADILRLTQWPNAQQPVLVVGHQPVLGQVLAQLLRMESGEHAVRKGAAWWLRTQDRDGAAQTVVWAVQSPETA
jgi:phosphohistidine phosphatase